MNNAARCGVALEVLFEDVDDFELHFCSEFHAVDVLSFNGASQTILDRLHQISQTGVLDAFAQG